MQAPRNAYDLFPADQFDAWVDGVRAKIIDGLERQHAPDEHEVRVPELSSQALQAITLARREAEINRHAGPSSSYSRINVSESYEVEGEEAMADETVIIETHQSVVTRQVTRYSPSEQDDDERDDVDEDDNSGYPDEPMENDESQGTYPASLSPGADGHVVPREYDNTSNDDGNDQLGDDEEDELGEEQDEEDEDGEGIGEEGEDQEDDEIIMLDDSYEEGSDREMTPNGDRDELESDADDVVRHDDPTAISESWGVDESSRNAQETPASAMDQRPVEAVGTHAPSPNPDLPMDEPATNDTEDALEEGDPQGDPQGEGDWENTVAFVDSDDDLSEEDQSGSEDDEREERSGRSGPDDDEIISVADSSDEDGEGAGDSVSPRDRHMPIASSRQARSDPEDDGGEAEESEEGEDEDMDGSRSGLSDHSQSAREGDNVEDEESEDELDDHRSHHSAEEDRAQHRGLHQDIRQPTMPPTEETDGVYRGTVEIDGMAQEGVRMDEAYQLEEDDNDSQHDPEYSADERESAEDVQYGDEDRGGMLPDVELSDGHVPTTEEIYASQIPLEAQTKEEIECEIRQHDHSDFVEQAAIYPTEREEYDLDGEDGGHHVDGIPAGHENDEVVDETDPKDLEIASWGNEEPAVLQSLPFSATQSDHLEDQADVQSSPNVPEDMPPVLREDTDESPSGHPEQTLSPGGNAPQDSAAPPDVKNRKETEDRIDTSESMGGNETDNEDNDMDTERTTVSPVTVKSAAANKVESSEAFTSLGLRYEAFSGGAPSQVDLPSTVLPAQSATYGQETGYVGDDEMLLETEGTGASNKENAMHVDASGEGEMTQAEQPEPEGFGTIFDHGRSPADGPSATTHASTSPSATDANEVLGRPSQNSRDGLAPLTEQNLAQLPGLTETAADALQDSDIDIEDASVQPVVDVNMGHEAPVDRLVSALREVPETEEGEVSAQPSTDAHTPGGSPQEQSTSAVRLTSGGDTPSISPTAQRDTLSSPTPAADVVPSDETTLREEDDIFDVTNDRESGHQDQGGVEDVIAATVQGLPVAGSSRVSDALEPHLPIDILDPALSLHPAVLQEHPYRSKQHLDHAAEMARAERDNHLHAFEEVTQTIRDEVVTDLTGPRPSGISQQSEPTPDNTESHLANLSQSDQIASNDVNKAATAVLGDPERSQSTHEASELQLEVEQERPAGEDPIDGDDHRDEVGEEQTSNREPSQMTDQRSNRSDSGVQVMEASNTPKSRAQSVEDEAGEEDGQAEAIQGSASEEPSDGVTVSIVRVHEYPRAIHGSEPALVEPGFTSAESSEHEPDQTVQPADPTSIDNDESARNGILPLIVGPLEARPRIQDSLPAPCIPMETPAYVNRQGDAPRTPSPRPQEPEAAVASPDVRHHHHASGHRTSRPVSHLTANTESPASHTRSHCVYHKMEFDEGVHSHTLLIPGCSLGTVEQRLDAGARDLGEASGEEMKLKKDLLFGENFTQQMRSEEEGTLPSDLEHRLSLIVGREILREGHCYILPLAPGVPHSHPIEADAAEAEEEDGGIASRTRRRTSRTPGPSSGAAPVTPARDGQKRRRSRGPSASRTPASSSKKRMPDLSNVEEAGEEVEDGNKDEILDDEEMERSKKKRIVDVDGSPQAVGTMPHERGRNEEDGDHMDIDERVDVQPTPETRPAQTRKGWFGWLWGRS